MRDIVAVIVARNEQRYIGDTIRSLLGQTDAMREVVVVDDGSVDGTGRIAERLGCVVSVLPPHDVSFVGRPELAERWNVGLKMVKKYSPDYVLLMGADHVLQPDYVEQVLNRMEDRVVIASGWVQGTPYVETSPRGSGRLVNVDFWRSASGLQYPVAYGWESWLLFKAMQLGYESRCFKDVIMTLQRPIGLGAIRHEYWGKGMYALGYNWKYAIARSVITTFSSGSLMSGLKMIWGWFWHEGAERTDVADWVNAHQNKIFWGKLLRFIRRGGRR